MAEDITSLSIKINADAKSASSSIKTLASSLEKLQKALEGTSGIEAQLEELGTSLGSLSTVIQPLQKLSTVANSLKSFNQLPNTLGKLADMDWYEVSYGILNFVAALEPLFEKLKQNQTGLVALASVMKGQYPTAVEKATQSTTSLSDIMSTAYLKARMLWAVMRRIVNSVRGLASSSMEYQETLNLYHIALGEYYDEGVKYSKAIQDNFGIDAAEYLRYDAIFANMAKGFGLSAEKAELMGRNLTQMGYDLASVFNVDFETSMRKLESAISGQPRPMREWGFDLSEANLKMVALNHNITKNVENMSQAEKAQLRYIYLFETMAKLDMTGDLARTIETPANALRILEANIKLTGRAIGNVLIPAINTLLPYLTAFFKAIQNIANGLSSLTGFKITEIDYSALEDAAVGVEDDLDDATESAKKLKSFIMGFDELNVISPNSGSSGNGGVFADLIDLKLPDNTNWLKEGLQDRIDALVPGMEKLVKIASTLLATFMAMWAGTKIISGIQKMTTAVKSLSTSISGVGGLFGAIIAVEALLFTWTAEQAQLTRELEETAVWAQEEGVALDDVREALNDYFGALNFDKFGEWNEKIKYAESTLSKLSTEYETMSKRLFTKSEWNTEDIDNLTTAFNRLADAMDNLRDVKIGSLLEAIKTGIELNITPEITNRFTNLTGEIMALQDAISGDTANLRASYAEVLANIKKNGGIVSEDDKTRLSQIVSDLKAFSLDTNESYYKWQSSITEALFRGEQNIATGANKDEVKNNLDEFLADFTNYRKTISDSYYENVATLKQLAKIDREQYGGRFGISSKESQYLTDLTAAYNREMEEVNNSYNEVINKLIDQYAKANPMYASADSQKKYQDLIERYARQGLYGGVVYRDPEDERFMAGYEAYQELVSILSGGIQVNVTTTIDGEEVATIVTNNNQNATMGGGGRTWQNMTQ